MDELRKIMGLDEGYKVIKVEEKKNGKTVAKYIYVETIVKKYKCPKCGKYTKSIHDKLKPIVLKYVKVSEVLGNLLKDTNLLTDHRGDKNYKLWNIAYR